MLSESVALAVDRKPCSSMGGGGTEIPARKTALQVTAGCSNAHIFKSEYPPTEVTVHEIKRPQSGDEPGRGGRTPTPGGYRGTDATRGRARRLTRGPRRGPGGPCHWRCQDSPGGGRTASASRDSELGAAAPPRVSATTDARGGEAHTGARPPPADSASSSPTREGREITLRLLS